MSPDGSTVLDVLAICGSLRAGSYNAGLVRELADVAPDSMAVDVLDGLDELPLINNDLGRRRRTARAGAADLGPDPPRRRGGPRRPGVLLRRSGAAEEPARLDVVPTAGELLPVQAGRAGGRLG